MEPEPERTGIVRKRKHSTSRPPTAHVGEESSKRRPSRAGRQPTSEENQPQVGVQMKTNLGGPSPGKMEIRGEALTSSSSTEPTVVSSAAQVAPEKFSSLESDRQGQADKSGPAADSNRTKSSTVNRED